MANMSVEYIPRVSVVESKDSLNYTSWLLFSNHSPYKLYHLTCQPAMDISVYYSSHSLTECFMLEVQYLQSNTYLIKYGYDVSQSVKEFLFYWKYQISWILGVILGFEETIKLNLLLKPAKESRDRFQPLLPSL